MILNSCKLSSIFSSGIRSKIIAFFLSVILLLEFLDFLFSFLILLYFFCYVICKTAKSANMAINLHIIKICIQLLLILVMGVNKLH